MKRFGSAAWNGSLREGKGLVSTESRALENHPYTFFSRYGEKPGTNPEELLGAAHAACFTMSFVRLLGMADFVPEHDRLKRVLVDAQYLRGDGKMDRGDGKAIAVLVDDSFRFAVDLLRHEVRHAE